jgi:hypothetical protein
VFTYSLSNGNLKEKTPMLTSRVGGAIYRLGKIAYIFGGYNYSDGDLDLCENYSMVNDSWAKIPKLPNPTTLTSAARIGADIYVTGASAVSIAVLDTVNVKMSELMLQEPLNKHYHAIFTNGEDLFITGKQDCHQIKTDGTQIVKAEGVLINEWVCGPAIYHDGYLHFIPEDKHSVYGAVLGEPIISVLMKNCFK